MFAIGNAMFANGNEMGHLLFDAPLHPSRILGNHHFWT
jgi:hypothetical protein